MAALLRTICISWTSLSAQHVAMPRCKKYESPIHPLPYGPLPGLVDYDRLERRRILRLGLNPRYARTYDVRRMQPPPTEAPFPERLCRRVPVLPIHWVNKYSIRAGVASGNTISPFTTMQLVYWAPFIDENADFRNRKTGVRI